MQDALGLNDLAVEDANIAHQRTMQDTYDDSLFLVLRTVRLDGEPRRLEFGETHVFVSTRYLVSARRAVSPSTGLSSHLARVECPVIPVETRPCFQDVHDHVLRINELIDTVHQLSATALDAHLALPSVSQNEDTRRLAARAAILGVPTPIEGLYGMSFDSIPEIHWRFGYRVAMAFMLLACILLDRGFKRSGWLQGRGARRGRLPAPA